MAITGKLPIIPTVEAIEDKQRCIDYWGARCEKAEAKLERVKDVCRRWGQAEIALAMIKGHLLP